MVNRLSSRKAFPVFLAFYAVCLVSLVSKLSLWLDEIVDLIGIRDYDFVRLIAWVPVNAGGVPLGYLTRFATIHLFGYSIFAARLPSVLFSLLAGWGIFVLGRRLKLRFPLLPVLIFCAAPLQFRYALESRPYSLALALSIWATVVFLDLLEATSLWRVSMYCVLVLLGLYTMPYTVFVPGAHVVWLCFAAGQPNRSRVLLVSGVSIMLAALGFLPWFIWTAHVWGRSVTDEHLRYTIGPKAALLISRELVGAGYVGTAIIAGLAWFGFKDGVRDYAARLFWLLYTVMPVVLAVAADVMFGYFLAIRQVIFVLAPLSLMAALGIERLAVSRRRAAAAVCSLLVAVFLVADVRFFLRPREDWDAASRILRTLAAQGSCIAFEPPRSMELYRFFVPELANDQCSGKIASGRSVAVAVSPYGAGAESGLETKLSSNGFTNIRQFNPRGPRIELYQRK